MTRIALAFAAGVFAVHAWPTPLPLVVLGVAAASAVVCAVSRRVLAAAICAGVVVAGVASYRVLADRLPAERHGDDVLVTGTIASLPDGDSVARFAFQPDRRLHPELPREIRVSWYLDAPPPRAATRWTLALRLRTPRGTLNPASFDYERWLAARRIGATAAVRPHPAPVQHGDARAPGLTAIRAAVDDALDAALAPGARRGVIRGLGLGERGELTPREWEVFARTGTAHLMAISGLHVGMVAALFFAVGRMLADRIPLSADHAREVGVMSGLLAAAGYAALAGFAVPTRRALVMLVAGGALLCMRRSGAAFATLSVALLVVLALDPLAPLTIGFWLSFAAVAAIAWRVVYRRAPGGAASQLVRVQWAVSLGLLPLSLWFFQRGSVAAPVVNLVAVPWFTMLVVPAVLGGVALASSGFADAAAVWLRATSAVVEFTWWALEWAAGWPWAQRFTPRPPALTVALALGGAVTLLAPRGVPGRTAVGIALLLPMLVWTPRAPEPGGWRLTVLDVGQGLAAVVETHRHALLYDAGPAYGPDADAGARVVVPFLRARGVTRLDALIVSHPHADHDGGADSVRDAFIIERERIGAMPGQGRPQPCRAGEHWMRDGVEFRVLYPDEPSGEPNLDSCVLLVRGTGASALLPGDAEWPAELRMTRPPSRVPPVHVVIAPHHGSATSSTPRFVARTMPTLVIVPAGYRNRWSFPARAVVERWRAVGAEVLVTGDTGAVVVEAGRDGLRSSTVERAARPAWWRAD